jgi:hypothetical protein
LIWLSALVKVRANVPLLSSLPIVHGFLMILGSLRRGARRARAIYDFLFTYGVFIVHFREIQKLKGRVQIRYEGSEPGENMPLQP